MTNIPQYIKDRQIILLEEFKSLFSDQQELLNWFSVKELEEYPFPKKANSLAGRYLIKKSILTRLKLENQGNELEILNNTLGKPEIYFSRNIEKLVGKENLQNIHCSMSHSKVFVASLVIFSQ
jgi:phosphopantetheinyl transferase (holo-ACP synthase)